MPQSVARKWVKIFSNAGNYGIIWWIKKERRYKQWLGSSSRRSSSKFQNFQTSNTTRLARQSVSSNLKRRNNMKIYPLLKLCLFAMQLLLAMNEIWAQTYNIISFAGSGQGYRDGAATIAQFKYPYFAATDSAGNVYISDGYNHRIRRITQDGLVTTFAGSGTAGFLDGQGTSASFRYPADMDFDSAGNLYLADNQNHRIRKISPTGLVSTLAGSGTAGFADGQDTAASFNYPCGVAVDLVGSVFVGDPGNRRIRKVTPGGLVSTHAGSGSTGLVDGPASSAAFQVPAFTVISLGMTIDTAGNLYVADNYSIRKVSICGIVSTIAGLSGTAGSVEGPATAASFNGASGIDIDSMGNFYITSYNDNRIRKLSSDGQVSFVAGNLGLPFDIAVDKYDNLWIPDNNSQTIRKVLVCYSTSTFVSTSATCICNSGYYQLSNGSCVACLPNQVSRADRSGCDCISGMYLSSLAPICLTCPLFGTCNTTAITSCQAGYKVNSAGTACEQCPIGTQSAANYVSCVSCTAGTNYRSVLAQSTCQTCPTNAACTVTGFTCNAGYEPTGDGTGCQICGEGYNKQAAGNTACTQCAVGTESAVNRLSCTACGSGKYRPLTIFNKCIPCPANGACTAIVLTCNTGFKLNAAGDGCDQCPIGQQSNAGFTACVACTAGTNYRSSLTQTICISCPDNATCITTGFTCSAGYEPTGDGLGCSQCLDGYSKSTSGNTACSQCVTGTESATNRQSCTNCAAGYYRSSFANARCISCPAGATCSTSAITRCPNGFKKNIAGDGCDQCPIGQSSSDGLNCQGCQAGYFKPDLSFQTCIKCPDGSPSCGGSAVSCQAGYYFDPNVQCRRNDTYFGLTQTGTVTGSTVTSYFTITQTSTSTSTTTSTTSIFFTATQVQQSTQISTIISTGQVPVQTLTVVQAVTGIQIATVSVSISQGGTTQTVTVSTSSKQTELPQPQAQAANSVTIDFIGTLPISPLVFAGIAFAIGAFLMLIVSLLCCRRSQSRRKDDEFEGAGMTTTALNTTSQRTFTNTASIR